MTQVVTISTEELRSMKPVKSNDLENGRMWGRWRYKKETEVLELMDEFRDLEFELDYVDKDSRTGVGFLVWLMAKEDQVSREDLVALARALVSLRTPVLP